MYWHLVENHPSHNTVTATSRAMRLWLLGTYLPGNGSICLFIGELFINWFDDNSGSVED